MVYQFTVTSQEIPDFTLIIEVNAHDTFSDLHQLLQNTCGFESNQLASFFLAGPNCGRHTEITQLDMEWIGQDKYVMDRTPIQNLLTHTNQKMFYVFDFFTERLLNIELTLIFMGKNLTEPSVIYQAGNAPSQMLVEEPLSEEKNLKPDEECSNYGDLDDYTEIFGEIEDLNRGGV